MEGVGLPLVSKVWGETGPGVLIDLCLFSFFKVQYLEKTKAVMGTSKIINRWVIKINK